MRVDPKRYLLMLLLSYCVLGQDSGGSIEGTVRDAVSGAAIPDARVHLRGYRPVGQPPVNLQQKTIAGGLFRFDGLPAGPYAIAVDKPGYVGSDYSGGPMESVRLAAGGAVEKVVVDLTPTGAVEGQILDEDSKPVKGVLLYAVRPNAPRVMAISGAEGRYRLEYLAPATYRIEVRVPYPLRKETLKREPDSGALLGDRIPSYRLEQCRWGRARSSAASTYACSAPNWSGSAGRRWTAGLGTSTGRGSTDPSL